MQIFYLSSNFKLKKKLIHRFRKGKMNIRIYYFISTEKKKLIHLSLKDNKGLRDIKILLRIKRR